MLEPFLRPRAGQALNALMAVASAGLLFADAGVTTATGFIPAWIIFPLVSLFFAIRFVGITAGTWRDAREMPWGYRVASWVLLLGLFALVGALASRWGWAALLAIAALDAAGALVPHRPSGDGAWWQRLRAPDLHGAGRWALAVAGYVALVAAVHALWARTVPYGPLVDWTMLVIGFALLIRFVAPGARAPEPAARPPPAHRVHAPRDDALPDPGLADVSAACRALVDEGDAEPFFAAVKRTAAFGHAPDAAVADAEARVLAALSRAGTSRRADIDAALAALEDAFAARGDAPHTPRRKSQS